MNMKSWLHIGQEEPITMPKEYQVYFKQERLGTVTFDPMAPELLKRYRHWLNDGARIISAAEKKLLSGSVPPSEAVKVLHMVEEKTLEGACRVIGNDDLRSLFKAHRPFDIVGDDGETFIHLILDGLIAVAERMQAITHDRR